MKCVLRITAYLMVFVFFGFGELNLKLNSAFGHLLDSEQSFAAPPARHTGNELATEDPVGFAERLIVLEEKIARLEKDPLKECRLRIVKTGIRHAMCPRGSFVSGARLNSADDTLMILDCAYYRIECPKMESSINIFDFPMVNGN